jgi:hypothetical protein
MLVIQQRLLAVFPRTIQTIFFYVRRYLIQFSNILSRFRSPAAELHIFRPEIVFDVLRMKESRKTYMPTISIPLC